jgi:hypothetical protein
MPSQSETGRKRKSGMAARDTHECTVTSQAIMIKKIKNKTFLIKISFERKLLIFIFDKFVLQIRKLKSIRLVSFNSPIEIFI